jgi:hypothetical protein
MSGNARARGITIAAAITVFLLWVGLYEVQAADICIAVATRDVPAVENPSSILKKGAVDDSITEYLVNKRTGRTFFCSHGGYCYPTHVEIGGDLLEALKLTNCRVAQAPYPTTYGDDDNITYGLEPIRSKIAAALLRYDDLDNKFLEMGLCSACADNVAQFYLKQPDSQCANLARSALEGNPDALQTLQGDPSYCIWHYTAQK